MTADEVAKLSEELATMKPLLEEAVKESVATMEQISKDTVSITIQYNTKDFCIFCKFTSVYPICKAK